MEDYVLLKGKITGKWYDLDKTAHYHIMAETMGVEYDIAVNVGSVVREWGSNEFKSSELLVYHDESYNNKIAKMDERMRHLEEENLKLKEYVEESRKIQVDNQEKVKIVLGELGSLIDSINKNYVPKEKFDQLVNEVKGKGKTTPAAPVATEETPAAE